MHIIETLGRYTKYRPAQMQFKPEGDRYTSLLTSLSRVLFWTGSLRCGVHNMWHRSSQSFKYSSPPTNHCVALLYNQNSVAPSFLPFCWHLLSMLPCTAGSIKAAFPITINVPNTYWTMLPIRRVLVLESLRIKIFFKNLIGLKLGHFYHKFWFHLPPDQNGCNLNTW